MLSCALKGIPQSIYRLPADHGYFHQDWLHGTDITPWCLIGLTVLQCRCSSPSCWCPVQGEWNKRWWSILMDKNGAANSKPAHLNWNICLISGYGRGVGWNIMHTLPLLFPRILSVSLVDHQAIKEQTSFKYDRVKSDVAYIGQHCCKSNAKLDLEVAYRWTT